MASALDSKGEDIFETGWCSGTSQRLIMTDVDGDLDPDAICHDRTTGRLTLASGYARLLKPNGWTSPHSWCTGPNDKLLVGDFNLYGAADLLCFTSTTGRKQIDFHLPSTHYSGTDWEGTHAGWCTRPGAELLAGDFSGDGHTDLLCNERDRNLRYIDYGSASPGQRFDGVSDWSGEAVWCSHSGAKLYTGDFNGDGKTDLMCHTQPTGAVDIDLANLEDDGRPFTRTGHNDRELRVPDPVSGRTFCSMGRLELGDYDGDGTTDLLCYYTPTDTWPSLWGAGRSADLLRWDRAFGWKGRIRLRRVNAATQPWVVRP